MTKRYNDKITIMPGGGITSDNIKYIKETTKAKEYHMGANKSFDSLMEYRKENVFMGGALRLPEFGVKITDEDKVKEIIAKI